MSQVQIVSFFGYDCYTKIDRYAKLLGYVFVCINSTIEMEMTCSIDDKTAQGVCSNQLQTKKVSRYV